MKNIAVLGGGSWATALIKILCEENESISINWWLRKKDDVEYIKKYAHNPSYLSDVPISKTKVNPLHDITKCVENVDVIIIAIPAAFVSESLSTLSRFHFKNKIVVSAVKGMIPKSNLLITEYVEKQFDVEKKNICVIAGPCHAEEVALERQSYLTVGCEFSENATVIAKLLTCRFVKCSTIDEVMGVEFAAVMKNIIAIASGIAHGVGFGDNFQAVLVSNAMEEIKRFLREVNPRDRNYSSSAYLGDLLVTTYSQFSRNRTFGNMIGRGYSVKSAQMEMNMIAEGYYAVECIYEVNKKYNIEMPITSAVYHVLYEKISPRVEFQLLSSELK